ncbi:cytochrome b/b6 domain-containing protein [Sphingobium subterraneum]|uniref:Cytochrome b561 n=1 Tax=Sphingobium subterraneum TaxID=627688 RepID=A0A841IXN3_9SPHN|nr:cytochrome b561 [Sphingobium subterraneum]
MRPHERSRYPARAIILHWMIALLLIANLVIGLRMEALAGMDQFRVFQLHKSIGITVLLLTLIRIAIRLSYTAPPYPDGVAGWQRMLSKTVHGAFYGIMLGLPLTGWIVVSASPLNIPTVLFNMIPWPDIGPLTQLSLAKKKALSGTVGDVHVLLTYLTYGLIALHVTGALKHQFSGPVSVLYRMLPLSFLRKERPS